MKRLSVVRHSGPGVDKIHRGMRRFGRLKPDYRRTDVHSVALKLATVDPDGAFHPSSNGRPGVSGMMTWMMGRSKMLNPKIKKTQPTRVDWVGLTGGRVSFRS
jgi:hypothetical protein